MVVGCRQKFNSFRGKTFKTARNFLTLLLKLENFSVLLFRKHLYYKLKLRFELLMQVAYKHHLTILSIVSRLFKCIFCSQFISLEAICSIKLND